MMNRKMKDKMGRAMPKRGDMSDKMGRAMAGTKSGGVRKMQAGGIPRMAPPFMGRISDPVPPEAPPPSKKVPPMPSKKAPPPDPRVIAAMRAAQQSRGGRGMPMARGGMKTGGNVKKYGTGGSIYRKAADGVAHKGKTKARMVKMRMGGEC